MHKAPLVPHPDSNPGRVTRIEAGISVSPKMLRLSYWLEGELATLRIPADAGLQRGDKLWEHTCFEAFVRQKGQSAYYEFNFSPSRAWQAMRFRAYRDGGAIAETPVTQVMVSREAAVLRLDALVMLDRLPEPPGRPLQLGLSAVVENREGGISFWALKHASGRADFHHDDTFVLEHA
ncbi:MAG TPA: DOMON-like domain-containing protein [Nevskiaceae bacterium]|nr:DOMON-like domain-containing protein [Nevskiaceae bacterium]